MQSQVTNQIYIEYIFTVSPQEPWTDVLIAQLGTINFESFETTDTGCKAYVLKTLENNDAITSLDIMQSDLVDIAFAKAEVPPTNWNAKWEENFNPIVVNNRCEIRAPFHKSAGLEYEIIIEPKMSFGTGHHQTTYMMVQHLLEEDLTDKQILDMGSGTAVLAILAQLRGARSIDAIDIDTWCYENAVENIALNQAFKVTPVLGTAAQLKDKSYDFIIANINRNILLQDIPEYSKVLVENGIILFSGFYTQDLESIKALCKLHKLIYDTHTTRDNWVAARFVKS